MLCILGNNSLHSCIVHDNKYDYEWQTAFKDEILLFFRLRFLVIIKMLNKEYRIFDAFE